MLSRLGADHEALLLHDPQDRPSAGRAAAKADGTGAITSMPDSYDQLLKKVGGEISAPPHEG